MVYSTDRFTGIYHISSCYGIFVRSECLPLGLTCLDFIYSRDFSPENHFQLPKHTDLERISRFAIPMGLVSVLRWAGSNVIKAIVFPNCCMDPVPVDRPLSW